MCTKADKDMINSWYYKRKQENMPIETLPQVGYIVPDIAAGFLIKTDCSFCIIEPFFSNPEADKDLRGEALDLIVQNLTDMAKHLGFTEIYGFSTSAPMINRVLKHGFSIHETNSTTVFKEIV